MGTKHQSSLLMDELSKAQDTLYSLFDEIGLAKHDCEGREASLFTALNAALQEQMRSVVAEKNSLVDECNKIISLIKQMERSLDDKKRSSEELRVSPPLLKCLDKLKSRQEDVKVRHAERYTAVRRLAHSLEQYAERLEPSIIQIPLPPATSDSSSIASFDLSYAYYERLDNECNRVYNEYSKRVATVTTLSKDIISLYAELGVPNAQTDRSIVEFGAKDPEKLGLKLDDLQRLREKKEKLIGEMERRRERIDDLKQEIEELWDKLAVDPAERKKFLAQHRGYNMKVIRGLEEELDRMMELKRENLQLFVEEARQTLQILWDKLYYSDDQIIEFHPAHSEIYTDALLTAHEMEIRRLQLVLEERAPMINMIEKHRSLVSDREQLALSANDASRLISRGGSGNRDPTRLLREERMRKRIAKELPKVELELKRTLEDWEEEHGEPFLVNGEDYMETLIKMSPLLQSRTGPKPTPAPPVGRDAPKTGRWNPPATGSIQRARSHTTSSTASRPASRAKTPNGFQPRSKTPTGGPAMTAPAPSIGRAGGRTIAVTVHRSGAKTPGPGGRIPLSGTVPASPHRLRAPLSIFPEGSNSPDRRAPPSLVRSQSAKSTLRGAMSVGPGSISKPIQLMGPPPPMMRTPQNTFPPYLRQQRERERQRMSNTSSISREGTVKSVRSVSPEEMWNADEENQKARVVTPRPKSFPPRAVGYSFEREESSSNGDSESTRLFSGSSTATTDTTVSSTGNWEAFGDETEDEGSDEGDGEYSERGYEEYPEKQRVEGSLMAHDGRCDDDWSSQASRSRY